MSVQGAPRSRVKVTHDGIVPNTPAGITPGPVFSHPGDLTSVFSGRYYFHDQVLVTEVYLSMTEVIAGDVIVKLLRTSDPPSLYGGVVAVLTMPMGQDHMFLNLASGQPNVTLPAGLTSVGYRARDWMSVEAYGTGGGVAKNLLVETFVAPGTPPALPAPVVIIG